MDEVLSQLESARVAKLIAREQNRTAKVAGRKILVQCRQLLLQCGSGAACTAIWLSGRRLITSPTHAAGEVGLTPAPHHPRSASCLRSSGLLHRFHR